jgi:hypothetical protein
MVESGNKQCCGSGSAWIRIQLVARIRIRIRKADPDPDPGGLIRAKMKKNAAKSQIISHKSIKINKIGKKLFICVVIYITLYIIYLPPTSM